jgi:hypothetical protein
MEAIEVKKLILVSIVLLLSVHTAFAADFTDYELAQLLLDKAISEGWVKDAQYEDADLLKFVKDHNLMDVEKLSGDTVSLEVVRQSLTKYDEVKSKMKAIKEEAPSDDAEGDSKLGLVDQMIQNVLEAKTLEPLSLEELQKRVDEESVYCLPGCHMEDGILYGAGGDPALAAAKLRALDAARTLAVHAEENDMMISIAVGGTAVVITYGENREALRTSSYMFEVIFRGDGDFYEDEELDGKTYAIDCAVKVRNLFAIHRLHDKFEVGSKEGSIQRSREWFLNHNGIDEDILQAYYDALKVVDLKTAEALFMKTVTDYRYSLFNAYPSLSKNGAFELNNQKFYKEDVRGFDNLSHHSSLRYNYLK